MCSETEQKNQQRQQMTDQSITVSLFRALNPAEGVHSSPSGLESAPLYFPANPN